jgi:RNA polymerase sigma factor (sigma-70 family)
LSGKSPKEREHYLIRLEEGRLYEVSRDVYLCWYAGDRQERYQIERDRKHNVCSYEYLGEAAFGEEGNNIGDVIPSPEGSAEEQVLRKLLKDKLYGALAKLEPEEQRLIRAIFFENVSLRSYAKQQGVTHRTVQKRKDRILKKLREWMQ